MALSDITREFGLAVDRFRFSSPVEYVYNPLTYALAGYLAYLKRFGAGEKEYVFLGMNPGPFGMMQTGVPFGDVAMVKDFLGIEAKIGAPKKFHPARPVEGFFCERSEVSGTRVWSAVREQFGAAENFFEKHFVANYCPLAFLEESGKNRTPDKLLAREKEILFAACDEYLRATVHALRPKWVIGVGGFAAERARIALIDLVQSGKINVGQILHPSPANPRANRGWAKIVKEELKEMGYQGASR